MSEDIVLRDRPVLTPIFIIWPLGALLMGAPLLVIPPLVLGQAWQVFTTIMAIVGLLVIAMCGWYFLVELVDSKTTEYTLTARHLTKEWGILHRDQKVIPLENVQVVTIRQPLLGRLLDYGTVVVQAAGLGGVRISMVAKPHQWQKAILQSMPARQDGLATRR